ncbi:hypothetical protein RJ639_037011 [Escallonia herrerae]|uniref:BAG family molecular chaperone regulator 4 n=1 Tax=Escallonia herrerae TaxID=1293975 RepID=A0AA89B7L9_9ASTE|nr:hypothetical protein RJ639_037011 [Escallonia herrerae]
MEGDVKGVIFQEIGLEPKDQRLLFRGKEKEDQDHLHEAGVKNNSKLLLMKDTTSKESVLEELKGGCELSKGSVAIAQVKEEDDRLSEQVDTLRRIVSGGNKVAEKDFVFLTEMLMRQMLKLDSIEAEGEAKVQRKSEVHRVQSLVEIMDDLKAQNSNPISNSSNAAPVNEKFEPEVGSSHTPLPMPSATKVTQDWEVFE